jgi:ATPase subunit of ABC transporter with duplicated ATPase domains
MNTLKNKAENSTTKIKSVHGEKMDKISEDLELLKLKISDIDKIKFGIHNSSLHKGKILFAASDINFTYHDLPIWKSKLNVTITSGERISLRGSNGSGKTTLIKLILGSLVPKIGTIHRTINKSIYIDQDYSLINNTLNIYQQAQQFNKSGLEEHEIKIRLNRFLFGKEYWEKPCLVLSGGERMRLTLCCLSIYDQSPDVIVLDEPTNNLDIQNIDILITAIQGYEGTLIVVSHDESFLEQVNIGRIINLDIKE